MKLPRSVRSSKMGRRMTVYIPDALWRAVKKRNLPVSKILQKAIRNYITEGEDEKFQFELNKVLKKRLKQIKELCELD